MFYYFSQVKVKRFFFAALFFVLLAVLSGGCNLDGKQDDVNAPGTLPDLLRDEWRTEWDGYNIDTANLRYIADHGFGFTGTISFVSNYGSDSGVIIVNYTTPPTAGHNGNPYTAVYYRNLTGNAVQLANVINLSDYSSADAATLEEAKEKFTRGNMGLYVDWSFVLPYTNRAPAQ